MGQLPGTRCRACMFWPVRTKIPRLKRIADANGWPMEKRFRPLGEKDRQECLCYCAPEGNARNRIPAPYLSDRRILSNMLVR